MNFALKALAVFAVVFGLDFVWAYYTRAITGNRVGAACVYSAAIYLLGGLSTLGYVSNPWLLPFAVVGAMSGTFAAMKWEKQ